MFAGDLLGASESFSVSDATHFVADDLLNHERLWRRLISRLMSASLHVSISDPAATRGVKNIDMSALFGIMKSQTKPTSHCIANTNQDFCFSAHFFNGVFFPRLSLIFIACKQGQLFDLYENPQRHLMRMNLVEWVNSIGIEPRMNPKRPFTWCP
ncbi:hypothetical protein R6Q59_016031 [Mikania micrantha]